MKKIEIKTLEKHVGGACGKWVRRYNRAYKNGAGWEELQDLTNSLDDCIMEKYY